MLVNVWGNQCYGVKRKLKPQKPDQINDSYSEKACQVYTIPNESRGHNREPWFIQEVASVKTFYSDMECFIALKEIAVPGTANLVVTIWSICRTPLIYGMEIC